MWRIGIPLLSATLTISAAGRPAQKPVLEFEVASIKPNKSGDTSANLLPRRGGFRAVNVTVMQLVRFGFQIQEFQVSGQPSWFSSERYDVEAKAPDGVDAERDEVWQQMLQALLADRFKLAYHKERKEQSVYELVVSRNGHKLKQVPLTDCVSPLPAQCGFRASTSQIIGTQVSMEAFATRLSRSMGRTVVNKTNLDGVFDLLLQWAPDPQLDGGPSIFTALQEQLGLRVEAARSAVDLFVIDRVERPSEN